MSLTVTGATLYTAPINSATTSTSWTNIGWSQGITFEEYDPPPRCKHWRGPKSKTRCEVPENYPHELHSGRSPKGYWFFWKDEHDLAV